MAKIIRLKESKKLAVNMSGNLYMTEEGEFILVDKGETEFTTARNVPAELRKKFDAVAKAHKQSISAEKKKEKILAELAEEVRSAHDAENAAIKELFKCQSLLSHADFLLEFEKALPESLKAEMSAKGFSIEEYPYGIAYDSNSIYICRSKLIRKYDKSVPYAYDEYDGSFVMFDDAETDAAYIQDVKKNSKKLSVKANLVEGLETGDKFSIWYYGAYEIPIKEKKTAEYAKRLAKEFSDS